MDGIHYGNCIRHSRTDYPMHNLSAMKLTIKQTEALLTIYEQKALPSNTARFHKNTLNSLENKSLITLRKYGNGDFWELTDLALAPILYNFLTF